MEFVFEYIITLQTVPSEVLVIASHNVGFEKSYFPDMHTEVTKTVFQLCCKSHVPFEQNLLLETLIYFKFLTATVWKTDDKAFHNLSIEKQIVARNI